MDGFSLVAVEVLVLVDGFGNLRVSSLPGLFAPLAVDVDALVLVDGFGDLHVSPLPGLFAPFCNSGGSLRSPPAMYLMPLRGKS